MALFLLIYGITLLAIICVLMLENRSPLKTLTWIFLLVSLPVLGIILYVFFGRNLRKKMVINSRSLAAWLNRMECLKDDPRTDLAFPPQYRNLARLALCNSNSPLYFASKIETYSHGTEFFADLFEEVEKAQKYVHVEFYIFNSDEIGTAFASLLMRKRSQGVAVRVIIDDVGSWTMKKSLVRQMRDAGIELFCFLKVGIPAIGSKINYRNHRKIVVIDGLVGYTGGMNVADRYIRGTKWGEWRDMQIKLRGDAVCGLQKVFLADWYFVSQCYLKNDDLYYPKAVATSSGSLVQVVSSGPEGEWESVMQMFFLAISQARHYVFIQTPYFLPNSSLITALQTAALSGVDVRIIIPRRSDAQFALRSSCSYVDNMLKAGVRVYFYNPGFIHSKTMVVDGMIATVGTANMDYRSFEQNFEVNTWIYDPVFAGRLERNFMEDLNSSSQIDPVQWANRPRLTRLAESWARLFAPIM